MRREEMIRYDEFPFRIRELAHTNPVVQRVLGEFAFGNILTREEALCQMIAMLARDWKRDQQEAYNMLLKNAP